MLEEFVMQRMKDEWTSGELISTIDVLDSKLFITFDILGFRFLMAL